MKTNSDKKKEAIDEAPKLEAGKTSNVLDWSAIVLSALVLLLLVISRIQLFQVPLSRDEGTYGLLGKLALSGKLPYLDFFEMKPPALFYFTGIGTGLLGSNDVGLRLFLLCISLGSAAFIFGIGKKIMNTTMAVMAAVLFFLLSINLYTFGFALVAEHMVNLWLLAGFYCLFTNGKSLNYILAGTFLAVAVCIKQSAVLASPAFIWLIYVQHKTWVNSLRSFLYWVLGGTIVLAVLMAYLLLTNSLQEAIFWILTYPSKYADGLTWEKGRERLTFFLSNISSFQLFTISGIVLTLFGSLIFIKDKLIKVWWLWLVFSLPALFPGFRFYGQYWLMLFPSLALLVSYTLYLSIHQKSILKPVLFIFPLLFLGDFIRKKDYYFNNAKNEEINFLYKGNYFDEMKKLSLYAKKIIKPEESLMVFGSEPQMYLYTDKMPITKHIYMAMMSRNTEKAVQFSAEVMSDLEKKKPDYVLYNLLSYSWMLKDDGNHDLYSKSFTAVANNYTPVAAYNVAQKKFYFENERAKIDFYQPEQITLLKRK